MTPNSYNPQTELSVVQEPADTMDDLVAAAQSSLDFWDNPYDDQDWNNA